MKTLTQYIGAIFSTLYEIRQDILDHLKEKYPSCDTIVVDLRLEAAPFGTKVAYRGIISSSASLTQDGHEIKVHWSCTWSRLKQISHNMAVWDVATEANNRYAKTNPTKRALNIAAISTQQAKEIASHIAGILESDIETQLYIRNTK